MDAPASAAQSTTAPPSNLDNHDNMPTTPTHEQQATPAGDTIPGTSNHAGSSVQRGPQHTSTKSSYPSTPTHPWARQLMQTPRTPVCSTPITNRGAISPTSPNARSARLASIEHGLLEHELLNRGLAQVVDDSVVLLPTRQSPPPPYALPPVSSPPSAGVHITNNVFLTASSSSGNEDEMILPETLQDALTELQVPPVVYKEIKRCLRRGTGYLRDRWEEVLSHCGISEELIPFVVEVMEATD
jgi:hypothetical protein